MNVYSLITCPSLDRYPQCCLFFKSLRTGFPTAHITVISNGNPDDVEYELYKDCQNTDVLFHTWNRVTPHRYIWSLIKSSTEPFVILDGDTIFWTNCEPWAFSFSTALAGYYHPAMWNVFTNCPSVSRLHTSFLYINPILFQAQISAMYPNRNLTNAHKVFAHFDPIENRLVCTPAGFVFYDCCSQAYQLLGGTHFTPEQLDCYDHINSASFYDLMLELFHGADRENYIKIHELARTNPTALRGLWRQIDNYYAQQAALLK